MADEINPNTQRLQHAINWLMEVLTSVNDKGPEAGQTAVIVVQVEPVPGDPDAGFLNVRALPDIHRDYLVDALKKFVSDLEAGKTTFMPFATDDTTKVTQ